MLTSASKERIISKKGTIIGGANCLSQETVSCSKLVLGEGTFGIVYVGHILTLNLPCAIKYGKTENYFDVNHEASVFQRLTGSIYFPHFYGILNRKYLVAELIVDNDGKPLTIHRAKLDFALSESLWNTICRQLAEAIKHMHYVGLTHNDLKTNNVLLKPIEDG